MIRRWSWLALGLVTSILTAQEWEPGAELRVYLVGRPMGLLPRLVEGQPPNVARVVPQIDLVDTRGDFGPFEDYWLTHLTARLAIPETGTYGLRVKADDGALVWLNDYLVLDHDGLHPATAKETTLYLYQGFYRLEIQHFEELVLAELKLEWRPPGRPQWELVPTSALSTPRVARATQEGPKAVTPRPVTTPGTGSPVAGVHPAYERTEVRGPGFEPRVRGLAADGQDLRVLDASGALYRLFLDGTTTLLGQVGDPLGLAAEAVLTSTGPMGSDPIDDRLPRRLWLAGPTWLGDQLLAVQGPADLAGAARAELVRLQPGRPATLARDLLAPIAIEAAGDGQVYATDGGGGDPPGGRLVRYRLGEAGVLVEPVVWLPAELVGWPTQPETVPAGIYAGQVLVGDIDRGGLKRIFVETIGGQPQGALFRFSQGFPAGVSRLLAVGDDLIVGGDGGSAAWGELGKRPFGLDRLRPSGAVAFEPLAVRARANGLELEFTAPLAERAGWDALGYEVRSFQYQPHLAPPKRADERRLAVQSASVAPGGRRVFLEIPDLEPDRVVHLRLPLNLRSAAGQPLWTGEAWYTLRRLSDEPGEPLTPPDGARPNTLSTADRADGWRLLFDGETAAGWRGFRSSGMPGEGWRLERGALVGRRGPVLLTVNRYADFELVLDWRAEPGATGGLLYRVTEDSAPAERTGPMVVLAASDTPGQPTSGGLDELYPPPESAVRAPGNWNELRLRVAGNRVEHWLNGQPTASYDLGSEDWRTRLATSRQAFWPHFGAAREGHLALLVTDGELRFRNLRIREAR